MSEESGTEGFLSSKDIILLEFARNGGRLEETNASIARRVKMDPSNLKRDLDGLESGDLIKPLAGRGYELTEKGWDRVEPLSFVPTTILFVALGVLIVAIAVIGFAYDFLGIPVLHYGLEASAVSFAFVLVWLYKRERENLSLLVRRRRRPVRRQKQAVNLT